MDPDEGLMAAKRKKKRRRKKLCGLDIALIVLATLVVLFTIAILIIYWKFQSEPETLIQYFLGSAIIELIVAGWIERQKQKRKGQKDEDTEQGL